MPGGVYYWVLQGTLTGFLANEIHGPYAAFTAGIYSANVHPAWYPLSIPHDTVPTGIHNVVHKGGYLLTKEVVHRDSHVHF